MRIRTFVAWIVVVSMLVYTAGSAFAYGSEGVYEPGTVLSCGCIEYCTCNPCACATCVDCRTNLIQKGFNVVGGTVQATKAVVGGAVWGTAVVVGGTFDAIFGRKCETKYTCAPMAQSCPPTCLPTCPKVCRPTCPKVCAPLPQSCPPTCKPTCPKKCKPACPTSCSELRYRFNVRPSSGYPAWEPYRACY